MTWLYSIHRMCQDRSSFTWHQSCQHCISIPLQWTFKNVLWKAIHLCKITCERRESAREQRIALYKSDQWQVLNLQASCHAVLRMFCLRDLQTSCQWGQSPQRGAAVILLMANYAKLICNWIWVFSQPNYPKEEHKHSNWILAPCPPNYPKEEQKHTCSANKSFPWCSLSRTWRFCVPVDN